MERNSLFLFLFMMFVWAGLCSAQTTGDKFVLIDGCFSMACHREFGMMKELK